MVLELGRAQAEFKLIELKHDSFDFNIIKQNKN